MPAELHRQTAPENLCRTVRFGPIDDKFYLAEMPTRPKSQLPPARQLHLTAKLGAHIGHGRSSVVYALEDISVGGLEPETVIPPLVVKVARLDRPAWLAREAWYYDEVECVQGSVVPYCFGWFEMNAGSLLKTTPDRKPTCHIRPLDKYPVRNRDKEKDLLPVFEPRPHPMLAERARRRSERDDIIAVLILERLSGEMLPIRCKVPRETR